jgi:PAS domain S-box-containing protein
MRQNMEELQATQEESARRELEMREILEAINNSVGNIEFDLFGVIQNVNERYAQFLGLKEEDLIGREHRNLLKLTHKQDMLYREMWEGFTSGSSVEMDLCYPTSYGDVWLRETYTPLKDASGEYKKVLSLSVDISDNKTKDRAIHAYRRELDEQGENLKNIIDQLNTHKSESELRENELLKESEATEEENRVQIESMKLLIEDLEEKIRKLTAGKS